MADDLIPALPTRLLSLPPPPGTDPYFTRLYQALYEEFVTMHTLWNTHFMQGTAAEQPPAEGTRRFYWVTDGTPHLEYDDGSWNAV